MQLKPAPFNSVAPTVGIYFDTRRATQENKYPVKIRVIFTVGYKKWLQRYYPTNVYLTPNEYEKVKEDRARNELKDKANLITSAHARAIDLITTNPRITLDLFNALYTGKIVLSTSLRAVFIQMNKYDPDSLFTSTRNSLLAFANVPDIPLGIIDKDWIKNYEAWMLKNGKSITTVAIYLRNLRTAFNFAIDKKIIPHDSYPFGRNGYHIPQTQNIKKSLPPQQMQLLLTAKTETDEEALALAYYRLSYYCIGMNFVDIARLKEENIQGDVIIYHRHKTKSRTHARKPIVIPLHASAKAIIKKYGTNSPCLFGIIHDELTEKQKHWRIKDWRDTTIKHIQAIAARVGIKEKIVIYTARHTAANRLLTQGTDIKTLQDLLGHSSILTTERYVSGLDLQKRKQLLKAL